MYLIFGAELLYVGSCVHTIFCPRKNGRSCLWSFSDSGATCKGGGCYLHV